MATPLRGKTSSDRARTTILAALLMLAPAALWPQATPTQAPGQTPKTAPQVEQVLPSYEGQHVSSVELAGRPDVNTSRLAPLLVQQAGQPFSRANVDASVAALKSTGLFHDVQLEIRPEPSGVRVLFVLQPAMYFGLYDFPGASKQFSYARLLQVTNYPPRGPYSPVDVSNAEQALLTLFRRSGYFLAEVQPELQVDKQHGLTNVVFHISLGRRAKFGTVNISGASPQETQHLEHAVRSLMARLRNSAIRPGKTYKLKTLQNATQYLENTLTKQGRLAAKVRLIGANYNPDSNRADINFHVQTGPLVHVKVEGAHLWSWTRRKLLPVYQQVGVDQELILEGQQNLLSHLQSKGYFNAKVDTKVQQQPGGETILYAVVKGPRHKVAGVRVAGNQYLPEKELMSQVKVEKAHFFGHGNYSEHLVHESVEKLSALYKANGFANATITPQVTTRNGNVLVTFRVEEGPQDIVETLRLEGNTLPESQIAPDGMRLEPGKPYSQKAADQDRNHIMARYLNLGYLIANFHESARYLPGQPHRLEVVYHISEGPRVHTATVVTLGRLHTQQELIRRDVANIRPGTPLTESQMLTAETRLYTPGVFDWAEIDPRRRITTQTEEDVIVKVHEAERNTLNYGFGFEVINRGGSVPSGTVAVPGIPPVGLPSSFKTSEKTFYGPRGTIEYIRNNVRGKGESISVGGLAGRLDQRGSFVYTDPNFRWTNWASNFSLSGEHNSENPIFTSRTGQVGFQLQRPLNEDKTQNFFIRYSFNETGLTRLLIPDLVPSQDRHVRLSTFSGVYTRDTRDNPLDATKGIYESFELDMNPGVLSSVDFGRLTAQAAYYKKIPANIVWANSLRLGLQQPFAASHVPLSEKFFSGGGSTLRGFPLNGAGPQRTIAACGNASDPSTCSLITVPVGGNQLLIVNSELRIPVPFNLPIVNKNLGFALFYDGGNVFEHVGFHDFAANYSNSIGGGLRYHTPLGPVRLDIGHNLNGPPGIKSTQIFITLGQAF